MTLARAVRKSAETEREAITEGRGSLAEARRRGFLEQIESYDASSGGARSLVEFFGLDEYETNSHAPR